MSSLKLNKILYLGTNTHIECINYFPLCNEFIFIDTLPRNEWDGLIEDDNIYNTSFIKIILDKFYSFGFCVNKIIDLYPNYKPYNVIKPYINPHLFEFIDKAKKRKIKYYCSTNILYNMTYLLHKDIYESDGLYVAGYEPDKILFNYFKLNDILLKKVFIGDNISNYDNFKSIELISEYFNSYYIISRDLETNKYIKIIQYLEI
jgi:hypothetical protein